MTDRVEATALGRKSGRSRVRKTAMALPAAEHCRGSSADAQFDGRSRSATLGGSLYRRPCYRPPSTRPRPLAQTVEKASSRGGQASAPVGRFRAADTTTSSPAALSAAIRQLCGSICGSSMPRPPSICGRAGMSSVPKNSRRSRRGSLGGFPESFTCCCSRRRAGALFRRGHGARGHRIAVAGGERAATRHARGIVGRGAALVPDSAGEAIRAMSRL